MADLKDLNKPDLTSLRSTEVWETVRGHIIRLWTMDYTGMAGLVAGMRRLVSGSNGDIKFVERQADNSEIVLFDSSALARSDGSNLGAKSIKATALDDGAALSNLGNSAVPKALNADLATRAANADQATSATSASQVDWSGIIGKPTDLNAFSNGPGYLTGSTGVTSVNGQRGSVTVSSFGTGQSWKGISRARGTNYYNSSSSAITVCFLHTGNQYSGDGSVSVNGVSVASAYLGNATKSYFTVIVPPGAYYNFNGAMAAVAELS